MLLPLVELTLLLTTALGHLRSHGEHQSNDASCSAYQPWRDWTECLWFNENGLDNLRANWVDACDIKMNMSNLINKWPMPDLPAACGHCSFRMRCRKRPNDDGCSALDFEREACQEYDGVCELPHLPISSMACNYDYMNHYLLQCANRADLRDHERETFQKIGHLLPHFHCVDSKTDNKCNCCCHPYEPAADGTTCVKADMPQCQAFNRWNDWSEKCIWFPLPEVRENIIDHCALDANMDKGRLKSLQIPESLASSIPGRCGYCSFKFKCRKRSIVSVDDKKECFPLQMQKKACGPDDCETCGEICEIPKIFNSCNITETLLRLIGPSIKSTMRKLPHMMQMGLLDTVSHLPYGNCMEKNDKCFCCCHPYEPNADGTACLVKDICKKPAELGIEVDLNLNDHK